MPARLTVAIPLFKAATWFSTIVENIERIPCDAIILLSEETASDDTAQLVAGHFKEDPRIQVRINNGKAGWREHCNFLIQESTTEFFSLLPQDDLVAPGYYEKLVLALDKSPEAGIAFGTIISEGLHQKNEAMPPPPFVPGKREPWKDAIELDRHWNLGIPFRGVIRKKVLKPIPATTGDRFADQIWIFSMALSAPLLPVPDAVYYKRYHRHSTHTKWQPLTREERRLALVAEINAVLHEDGVANKAIDFLNRPANSPQPGMRKYIYRFLKWPGR